MPKQVGEVAKDLSVSFDELSQVLQNLGIENKGETDILEDSEIDRVRIRFAGRGTAGRKVGARRVARRPKSAGKPSVVSSEEQGAASQAAAPAPTRKRRPSPKRLLESVAGQPDTGDSPATRRLGRAVRVPKGEGAPSARPAAKRAQTAPAAETVEAKAVGPGPQKSQTESGTVERRGGQRVIEASTRSAERSLKEAAEIVPPGPSGRVEIAEEVSAGPLGGELPAVAPPTPKPSPGRHKKSKKRGVDEDEVRRVRSRIEPSVPVVTSVQVRRGITVAEFATLIGVSPSEVVKKLVELGNMKPVTMSLTDEELELLGEALGVEVSIASPDRLRAKEEAVRADREAGEDEGKLKQRAPVVTVMGHVDHGKTLLLDKVRRANVVEKEAGGITQHIGAYRTVQDGRSITFIDTPGHEAFTAMRARGASVTDVAVLVVAADDGVMPQTTEAISHIKAAGVPMVVAINKVDKPEADPLRVKTQLTDQGVVVEELGGAVPCVEVSAMTGQGLRDLLDVILLVAELEDLKANPDAPGSGVCIEAHVDPGKGPVATVLVRRGTVRKGDAFVAGLTYGRVRAMLDENLKAMEAAGPSTPVQITGFEQVPEAGDDFRVVSDDKEARHISEERVLAKRQAEFVAPRVIRLEDIHEKIVADKRARLGVVVKTDTQGSLEALCDALRKLEHPEVELNLVHRAVGGITENDVRLAQAGEALVIGFNVRPDVNARREAALGGVEIRLYDVIYKAVEDIEAAVSGLLRAEHEEVVTGSAAVRATFKIPRVGVVAGCYVQDGVVSRGSDARLIRDGVVVYTGRIASLKRFKEDVKEVQSGFECGIGLESFQDLKEGDVIETFEIREVPRSR